MECNIEYIFFLSLNETRQLELSVGDAGYRAVAVYCLHSKKPFSSINSGQFVELRNSKLSRKDSAQRRLFIILSLSLSLSLYIYIYIYIYMFVCVRIKLRFGLKMLSVDAHLIKTDIRRKL